MKTFHLTLLVALMMLGARAPLHAAPPLSEMVRTSQVQVDPRLAETPLAAVPMPRQLADILLAVRLTNCFDAALVYTPTRGGHSLVWKLQFSAGPRADVPPVLRAAGFSAARNGWQKSVGSVKSGIVVWGAPETPTVYYTVLGNGGKLGFGDVISQCPELKVDWLGDAVYGGLRDLLPTEVRRNFVLRSGIVSKMTFGVARAQLAPLRKRVSGLLTSSGFDKGPDGGFRQAGTERAVAVMSDEKPVPQLTVHLVE